MSSHAQSLLIQAHATVACHSRELAGQFWQLVCEWKIQSRGLHRDFHGSARDSLAGRPSSREKHLENFFKILSLSVLAAVRLNLFNHLIGFILCQICL